MLEPTDDPHSLAERMIDQVIFAGRWLLAPIYVGLILGLVAVLIKFAQEAVELVSHGLQTSGDETIIAVLGLVDLSLMAGLVVMVMFTGYENFVSKLQLKGHKDRPDWMGKVDFSDLKLKLMASIVAISAIHLLESFMNIEHLSDRELGWATGIHMGFVVSAVLLAVVDRLTGQGHH